MPLSEFLRMARGKLESSQQKTDVSSRPDNGLVELVWENGQIVMQGQSSRVTNRNNSLQTNTSKATPSRFGKFESMLNDIGPEVPSGGLDLSQDDEIVPWLSYPMDDSLGQDYVSDLLPEISARSSFLSGVTDIVNTKTCSNNNRDDTFGNRALSMKDGRQNIRPPTNIGSNFLNFSHFSRAANLVKANADGNPAKSAVEPPRGEIPPQRTENLCVETSTKNDNLAKDGERIVEPMVASSSVGSGNSGDRVSCEQTHNSKRKFHDIDESDYRSDDVDTESLDAKKTNHVRGSKRGRAAEVHNLSERRRRDRINEKMRALQELIPNCNKADKASMLDEAIEYLKTLQLQVQIMSMGAGLCMPPMMFPTPHFPAMGFGMGMMDMNGVSSGYPMFPAPPMQFRPPVSGVPNFQRIPAFPMFGQGLQRPPFVPVTSSAMGSSSEVANTSSMNHKSNQATTEVLTQSTSMQDNKQGTNAVTTDISKEPGGPA